MRCCFARNISNYLGTKIFKQNPKQNALEFLAFGEGFVMDRLTARNLKQNLENNLYSSFATEGID